jgi:sec-independent protein translocase protein TatB
MFDITSTKLLLLGIVALVVIGPKDLPVLLRTLGRYAGMIRRQAAEFRSQFEDAIRESEIADLKKEVESMGKEAEASMHAAEHSVTTELDTIKADVESTTDRALTHDPSDRPPADEAETSALNGAEPHVEAAGETAPAEAKDEPVPAEHKGGA